MRLSLRFAFFSLLALLFFVPAQAQIGTGGVGAVLAVPQGEFADRIDGVGFGLAGDFVVTIPNTPVGLGLSGTFLTYGRESFREPLVDRVEVNVVTTNNIALGHVLLRLQPPSGTFRPYADALVGVGYLFTESRIEDVDFDGDRDIASSTNFDDATLSYGIGGGIMAEVYNSYGSSSGRPVSVSIDARVRYLFGGEADYLQEGGISSDRDGNLLLDVTRSSTDLLLPQLGVSIRF